MIRKSHTIISLNFEFGQGLDFPCKDIPNNIISEFITI